MSQLTKNDFKKITDYLWEVPKSFRADMRAPARAYVTEAMLQESFKDRSLEQLINVSTLPGILRYAIAMPDMHQGYASPIGGVVATKVEEGVIAPGVCGYDLNCGVRIVLSWYTLQELQPYLDKIATEINRSVPSGLGRGTGQKLSMEQMDKVLVGGAKYVVGKGYGEASDVENCESNGMLDWADPKAVSERAKRRALDQVGTLGSGNHFLEVQRVEKIFDEEVAKAFGLFKDQLVIMVHCGSRGLGHQVCTDYLREMIPVMKQKYKIKVPDHEFACVPFNSPEGQRYFAAMAAAANFAWANRQVITHFVRQAWLKALGDKAGLLTLLYDVAHNVAKREKYIIDGKETEALVHRKGATRAFPPGHAEIPKNYQAAGQPVLIPGSMGTASWILAGVPEGQQAFATTCHGAGRRLSRTAAIRAITGQQVVKQLKAQGIIVKCHSMRGIAEEAPLAYKDVDQVIEVVHNAGLSKKVARLRPAAVIKGE